MFLKQTCWPCAYEAFLASLEEEVADAVEVAEEEDAPLEADAPDARTLSLCAFLLR